PSTSYLCSLFLFYCSGAPRHLPSFPTRRSSDLRASRATSAAVRVMCRSSRQSRPRHAARQRYARGRCRTGGGGVPPYGTPESPPDRKSTRLNSSHVKISYAVFCLKKKKNKIDDQ